MTEEKTNLTGALADKAAKKIILEKIADSSDETLGKGTFWRSAAFMRDVDFVDVMDILLYYMSLQPDLSAFAAQIKTDDFWWQTVQNHYKNRARVLFPFFKMSPWSNGPGPMGGTMGCAEYYFVIRTGLYDKSLLAWLSWPEKLKMESERNWPRYKEKLIEQRLFPKLRRKYNRRILNAALTFAEEICDLMRQKAKQKSK